MAAIPEMSHQRRKKPATYGKPSRNGNDWSANTFDALEEYGKPRKAPASATLPSREVHTTAMDERPHMLKPVRTQEKKEQDIWDVPSSDDEAPSPIRITSPPRFQVRSRSTRDWKEPETKLAPWEEKQNRRSNSRSESHANGSRQRSPSLSELRAEPSQAMTETEDIERTPRALKIKKQKLVEVDRSNVSTSPPALSAAARLHAKRSQGAMSAMASRGDNIRQPFRTRTQPDSLSEDALSRPRKRARSVLHSGDEDHDVAMVDAPQNLPHHGLPEMPPENGVCGTAVYDISASDTDRHAVHIAKVAKRRVVKADPNHLNPTSRWKPRGTKRANAKILDDSETPDPTSTSPSVPGSVNVTPPPSSDVHTPPQPIDSRSPGSTGEAQGAMTPKQANLWKQLLSPVDIGPSPGVLAIEQLNLNSNRRSPQAASTIPDLTPKPRIAPGRQRARLVDRLKASAPGLDDEMSEQSEAESEESMQSSSNPTYNDKPVASQQSQSQSQMTRADGGPKITYARDRSFLREETFEEGLMFQLSEETPQKPAPATFGRNNSKQALQKSTFDLDESDDEGGSGRMRTVHELRAGGGNQRFMDDIGGLLDDIADHNISARGRRRTALMEITNKLTDRAYAEKFLRQGFERPLVNECGSTPDEIADFTTTAALVTLTSNDLPDHAVQSLRDGEYLQFLVRLLSKTSDVRRLARDRRYNMSKSAQLSFIGFVDTLAGRQSLWGDNKPSRMTPRLIALKSMEQVVQTLRRHGDRTELVAASDVAQIWPLHDDQASDMALSTEHALAVSVLEALSTSIQSLAWPSELVQRLGGLLATLASESEDSRPTLFLALRLCLNLTNGNVRNCRALSARPSVVSLLRAVQSGFAELGTTDASDEQRALRLDILLLSMGILMNLTEHDERAGEYASDPDGAATLGELVAVCQQGQRRALEAASEEESASNVAYGYLAVTLAQLCRYARPRDVIASRLPDGRLDALVSAVGEFVEYHKDVDRLSSEAGPGMDVWSSFTEKLQAVLARLKTEAGLAPVR